MPRNRRKSHPHNFSARVDDLELERLESIRHIYGDGANPSAIASTLLRSAAKVGASHYHEFMLRVQQTAAELASKG